jgi:hypothetical protein
VGYLFDEGLDVFLVEDEDLHVLVLIDFALVEYCAVLSHESVLDCVELLVEHDLLESTHHLVEVDIFGRRGSIYFILVLPYANISKSYPCSLPLNYSSIFKFKNLYRRQATKNHSNYRKEHISAQI